MIFVRVQSPAGRTVYTDGNYAPSTRVAPVTIALQQPGSHVFETLTPAGVVDYRGSVSNMSDGQSTSIDLVQTGFVTVNGPPGRSVYLDGQYAVSAGQVPITLSLDPGVHTIETLTAANAVDLRAVADVQSGQSQSVNLA